MGTKKCWKNDYIRDFYPLPPTPNPNKARSYFTGSLGSNCLSTSVRAMAVFQSDFSASIRLSRQATLWTCTSIGQTNWFILMFFQMPKSTPAASFLTIQRRYMFRRLQEELLWGVEMCFFVLSGLSSNEKKYRWNPARPFPMSGSFFCMPWVKAFSRLGSCPLNNLYPVV